MARRNDALLDVLRALLFVMAVVVGGIVIGGIIEAYHEPGDGAGMAEDAVNEDDLPRPD